MEWGYVQQQGHHSLEIAHSIDVKKVDKQLTPAINLKPTTSISVNNVRKCLLKSDFQACCSGIDLPPLKLLYSSKLPENKGYATTLVDKFLENYFLANISGHFSRK